MPKPTFKTVKRLAERVWVIFIVPIGCFVAMLKFALPVEGAAAILTYIGSLHLVGKKQEQANELSLANSFSD